MSFDSDNLKNIFENYSDIDKVLFLEKDSNDNDINQIILFGEIEENIINEIKSHDIFRNYDIIKYDDLEKWKIKRFAKKFGYKIYEKKQHEFVNYCNRMYMSKKTK